MNHLAMRLTVLSLLSTLSFCAFSAPSEILPLTVKDPAPTNTNTNTNTSGSLLNQKSLQTLDQRAFFALTIDPQGASSLMHLHLTRQSTLGLKPFMLHPTERLHWIAPSDQYSLNVQPLHVVKTHYTIEGLSANEHLIGLDVQVRTGTLFALSSWGVLYRLIPSSIPNTYSAQLVAPESVQSDEQQQAFKEQQRSFFSHWTGTNPPFSLSIPIGFDFNPTVDRIRVVTAHGLNLRLHPQTGTVVDSSPEQPQIQLDKPLHFSSDSAQQSSLSFDHPLILAAGYTYNAQNDKITTNFAIDAQGTLLHQGSLEGVTPSVSPNTGTLWHYMNLGTGELKDAHLDISDVGNAAFMVTQSFREPHYTFSYIDLMGKQVHPLFISKQPILGFTIAP